MLFRSVSKNVLYGVGNLTVRYVRLQFQMAKCAHGCATRSNKSYLIDEGPLFCQMAAPSLESGLLQNWGAITTPILVEAKPHPRCLLESPRALCWSCSAQKHTLLESATLCWSCSAQKQHSAGKPSALLELLCSKAHSAAPNLEPLVLVL